MLICGGRPIGWSRGRRGCRLRRTWMVMSGCFPERRRDFPPSAKADGAALLTVE